MMNTEPALPADRAAPRLLAGWGTLILILLVGAFWRSQRLPEMNYWFDESFCVKMAEFPVVELWQRSAQDSHPPLYFLLLKAWGLAFGTSPAAARLLSGTLGLAAVVGVYLFVREAYRPAREGAGSANVPALVAAALVALSPLHIAWSLQVRMYSLGTALTAFSSWLLIRALRREPARGTESLSGKGDRHPTSCGHPRTLPQHPGPSPLFRTGCDWGLYTLAAILLAYTHYFGLFTLAAQSLFAAGWLWFAGRGGGCGRMARLSPLIVSAVCLAFAWQFWLPSFLGQREQVVASFWTPPLSWEYVGHTFFQMFGVHQWAAASAIGGLAILQGAFLALLVLLLGRRPADAYVALAAAVPIVSVLVLSYVSRNILVAHYLQFSHLFLLIAAAVLACRIPWRPCRAAAIVLLVGGMATLSWRHHDWREQAAAKPGMQAAVQRLESIRRPGEPLLVCNPMLYTSALAYAGSRDELYTYGSGRQYPFFHGTAVMRDREYLSAGTLNAGRYDWAWALDANDWMGSSWSVRMPADWKQVGESRFPEYYCELVLRLYARESPETSIPKTSAAPGVASRASD